VRAQALVLALLLLPATAMADPVVVDIPPGEDTIVVLRKDTPAPWTGQLYSNETSLRWANWLQQYRFQLKQSELYGQEKLKSSEVLCLRKAEVTAAGHAEAIKLYRDRVAAQQASIATLQAEVSDPPFYRTVWFGFVTGVVVTGLAVGIGGAIIASVR
jgi:hypothetical protein